MNVDLTPDQRDLADGARDFLADFGSGAVLRARFDAGVEGTDLDDRRSVAQRWKALAAMGFLGLVVPEKYGGLGLGELELALILEQAGRTVLPEPLLETAVAALTLAESAEDAVREAWLPAIADGSAVATIALPGQQLVADAESADVFVMAGDDGMVRLRRRDEVHIEAQRNADYGRRLATVAPTAPGLVVSHAAERMVQRAAVASAAVLVGVGAHLLDATVEYTRMRVQFGRPIGSYQAVKHRLADVHQLLHNARPTVWVAAQVLNESGEEAPLLARCAKAFASQTSAAADDAALQFHGGIGFAWENDLQFWLKRSVGMQSAYGSAAWCRAGIADALFAN